MPARTPHRGAGGHPDVMTVCEPDLATTTPLALRRLRPSPPAPVPPVVHRQDVPASAWTALHLDGVLVPLWKGASRVAGTPECAAVRASAFGPLVPRRGAVGHLAAVWVHVGGAAPRRVTVLVRAGARRPDPHPDRSTAETDLAADDVELLGAVHVTTVARTAFDVARWVPTPTAVRALRSLLPHGLDPDETRRRVDACVGGRGLRAARVTLDQL